jgi:hypothetical protein
LVVRSPVEQPVPRYSAIEIGSRCERRVGFDAESIRRFAGLFGSNAVRAPLRGSL